MRCAECGKRVSLPSYKKIIIDTLRKDYICDNGHITTVLRYANSIEVNGKHSYVNDTFIPPPNRPEA